MDDSKRTRILLMLMAGILLIGGSLLWVNSRRQIQEEVAFQSGTTHKRHHKSKHRMAANGAKGAPGTGAGKNAQEANGALPGEKLAPGAKPNTSALSASEALQNKYLSQAPVKARLSGSNTFLSPPVVAPGNLPAALSKMEAPKPPLAALLPEKKEIAPTPMPVAIADAKADAGRADPFGAVTGYKVPRFAATAEPKDEEALAEPEAPDESGPTSLIGHVKRKLKQASHKMAKALVPPPPPVGASLVSEGGGGGGVSLPIDELPAPPTKPSIAEKMQLVSLIGDRAMFSFTDPKSVLINKWPRSITLDPAKSLSPLVLLPLVTTTPPSMKTVSVR